MILPGKKIQVPTSKEVENMNVLAIMGSPRKGQTNRAVNIFENHLKSLGEIEFSYIYLKDHNIQPCRGCGICLEKGEEHCPIKDDRQLLFDKMKRADGVIFATPNFSLQVSGLMKNFLDRFCFVFHRPCFFHKSSSAIVTQGVYGGNDIVKYLNSVGEFWGFNVCPGVSLTTPWGVTKPQRDWPQNEREKIESILKKTAGRFYNSLSAKAPEPGLKRLLLFRLVRTAHKYSTERARDYEYYKDQGWFEKPFYYETGLNLPKKILGSLMDRWQANQAVKNKS